MFENLTREAGKQEIKQQNVPKLLHLKLIVFRTDILQKLTLGAPDTLDVFVYVQPCLIRILLIYVLF